MIKIANILPVNKISENMPRQDIEMYLTHKVLEHPEKFEFLASDVKNNIDTYKILDNSACELGEGLDFDKVLKAAEIIDANEVVLPDIPRSGISLSKTLQYLKDINEDCPYDLAVPIQGETKEELVDCIRQVLCLNRVRTIMIPKWYCQMNSTNGLGRHSITLLVLKEMINLSVDKDIHWLGLDTGIRELITPIAQHVRSVDTGYFAALSTPQWSNLDVTSERPRELKIDLESMNVDMDRFANLIKQQKAIIGEME